MGMGCEGKRWSTARTRSIKTTLFISVSKGCVIFILRNIYNFVFSFITKLVTVVKIIPVHNVHLPHETLVYPPKIYLPTLIIVTVGPLPSHRE